MVLDSKCGSTNGLSESKATVDLICISNPNTSKSIQCVSFKVFLFCQRSQERYNLLFLSFELTGSPFFTLDLELFGVYCWFLSMAVWLQFKNIGTIPYLLLGGKKNALFYSLQLSCLNFTLSLVQFILDVLTEKISHFSMNLRMITLKILSSSFYS